MYAPLEQKITPGSLNLLPPGDAVASGDSLDLTGWWPGAAGKLEQTPGFTRRSAVANVAVTSLLHGDGRTYYGGGQKLFQIGRDTAGASIDTGYDTNPLGMLSFQGYAWIMNRSKQRRDDGTTVSSWTPAAPSAPTLALVAQPAAPLLDFIAGTLPSGTYWYWVTWEVEDVPPSLKSGINAPILPTGVRVTQPTAPEGATGWNVYRMSPGMTVPYKVNASPIAIATTTYADSGGTGQSDAEILARNVSLPGAPDVSGGMPAGYYEYYVTYQIQNVGETGPSTMASISVPADGGIVSITCPTTEDATVTGWHIYRRSPSFSTPLRLNEGVLPIARTFVWDYGDIYHMHDDSYLLQMGMELDTDKDSCPACKVMANSVFNGRIVVANSSTYPNRVWYTKPNQPAFFTGADNPQEGDWVDIGTDRQDEILFMSVRPQMIVVYRSKSIWRIVGDFEDTNSRIEVVVPDMGVVGVRSVVSTSLGDFFVNREGVFRFNGDWAEKQGVKIEPLFLGKSPENFTKITDTSKATCAIGFRNGRLWVSYPEDPATANTRTLIYHIETERWFGRGGGFGAFFEGGTYFLGGVSTSTGYVASLEDGYTDNGTAVALSYQSEYQDCGVPDREKTFADLVVTHNTGGATLTAIARTNKYSSTANDTFTLGTFSSSVLTTQTIPMVYPSDYAVTVLRGLPIRSRNLSVRITGSGTTSGQRVTLDGPLTLHYYLEARKGKRFDTDETDHGISGAKTVDEIELDIDTSDGAAALLVYSDLPGGAMTLRSTTAVAQTSGRQTLRIPITPVDGRLLRYVLTTTTYFSVYGFRARVLPIGVYLDGTQGETWTCEPDDLGNFQKVKLFSTVELDATATVVASLTLATDLPGTALATRFTQATPIISRRTLRYRLAGTTKGRLVKPLLTPGSGSVKLYGARVYARTLPDGAWGWHAFPVAQTPLVPTWVNVGIDQ